jgi:hypothetical protein
MSRAHPIPTMRRPSVSQPHPLLVDRVVYIQLDCDETETETSQRIARACAEAGVELGRAVVCLSPAAITKAIENRCAGGRRSPGRAEMAKAGDDGCDVVGFDHRGQG